MIESEDWSVIELALSRMLPELKKTTKIRVRSKRAAAPVVSERRVILDVDMWNDGPAIRVCDRKATTEEKKGISGVTQRTMSLTKNHRKTWPASRSTNGYRPLVS